MDPATFFTELKRRKVYRVAVAYAIVAWLLVQAASILFPTFEAPPWVMKVFVTAVILGFPVALILAWAFELTPGRNQARGRSCAARGEDAKSRPQMDRDNCRCRCARGCVACVSIYANTIIGDCRAAKTNRAGGKHGQISCCAAVREP